MNLMSSSPSTSLPTWACIALWISLGTSMILFNKLLLTTWGFRYPCLLTSWHCALATVLTQVMARTTNLLPGVEKGSVTMKNFTRKILPMAVFFAYGLVAGNMSYSYISLAYIQMIKAFTPVPLVLLSFMSGLEKPSLIVFGIVMIVSAGVTLSSIGELRFNAIGFTLMISAVLGDCFRMILMNLLLKDVQLDSLSLLYYTAPPSTILIFICFLVLEAGSLTVDIFTPSLCATLVFNGLLAFSLNIAVIYLVSNTSALVMSISGPLKDILVVTISVCILRSPITITQIFGFAVSLTGLYLYREYKSDPQRMTMALQDLFSCGFCFIPSNTTTSSAPTTASTTTAFITSVVTAAVDMARSTAKGVRVRSDNRMPSDGANSSNESNNRNDGNNGVRGNSDYNNNSNNQDGGENNGNDGGVDLEMQPLLVSQLEK